MTYHQSYHPYISQSDPLLKTNFPSTCPTGHYTSCFHYFILTSNSQGKPPTMKGGELAKRAERRDEASKELAKAEEKGDTENIEKFSKR